MALTSPYKYSPKEREFIIKCAAAGMRVTEARIACREHDPPIDLGDQAYKYYRQKYGVPYRQKQIEGKELALKAGFAQRAARVEALDKLARRIYEELIRDEDNRLWLLRRKSIGSGELQEIVEEQHFNQAGVTTFDLLLDSIAKELGERKNTQLSINLAASELANMTDEELDDAIAKLGGK